MYGPSMAFTYQSDLASATAEHPNCQQQRPILAPQHETISPGHKLSIWWLIYYIGIILVCYSQ